VASLTAAALTVSLVDYTQQHTTLGRKAVSSPVNLEFDLIAKYLDRLLKK
jgi:riboflavin synthase